DCASMYDDFDTNLAYNTNQLDTRREDRLTLDRLAELTGSDLYGSASNNINGNNGRSSSSSTSTRSRSPEPLLDEERYIVGLRLPEDTYINEVLLQPKRYPRPSSSSRNHESQGTDVATFDLPLPNQPIRSKNEGDITAFSLPIEMGELKDIRVPASRPGHWQQHQHQHQQQPDASNLGSVFVKPRPRKWQQQEVAEEVPRLPAVKRWWGNTYRQPRGQKTRRSQGKHYSCLKTCIQEGKLHPIQCHTLC
ncbi:unnamed protein product, partial [Meganyctiphanes norvegica]